MIRICKCGRIHVAHQNEQDKAIEKDKNLLLICAGCGAATVIGADTTPDWDNPEEEMHMMYAYDFSEHKDSVISADNFQSTEKNKGIETIMYSHGIRVPMMTGMYANSYYNGTFADECYPDFYKIQRTDVTVTEIMEFIDTYTHNRTTVDMNRFIRENSEDVLKQVASYYIEAFNWKGTKYEH